jgi:uncharacterized LabA/DUF88 family protein
MQAQRIEEVSELPPASDAERVYVAVDVQNVWYSSREQFGPKARMDFEKLRELISSKPLARIPRKLRMVAYTVTSSTRRRPDGTLRHVGMDKNNKFLDTLRRIGFAVRNRNMYAEKGSKKPFHTDWDIGIALDAMQHLDDYDTFSLVSGDGDYSILIDRLKDKGKFVEVLTFESTASRLLHASANRVIHITKDQLYFQETGSGEDKKSSR